MWARSWSSRASPTILVLLVVFFGKCVARTDPTSRYESAFLVYVALLAMTSDVVQVLFGIAPTASGPVAHFQPQHLAQDGKLNESLGQSRERSSRSVSQLFDLPFTGKGKTELCGMDCVSDTTWTTTCVYKHRLPKLEYEQRGSHREYSEPALIAHEAPHRRKMGTQNAPWALG